jgi:hypothetical protein
VSFPRHSSRHIHAALVDRVTAGLTSLDWIGPADAVPFGGNSLKVKDTRPFVGERLAQSIEVGDVVISAATEQPATLEEIGGPLASMELPFFIDCFMDSVAECAALTTDIRDLLCGRVDGFARFMPFIDKATGQLVPGWTLELDDVERAVPEHNLPTEWQSVHVTVVATFNEVVW